MINSKRKPEKLWVDEGREFYNSDQVRTSKYERKFEKGYTPTWTEEVFVVDKINMTNPVTYELKDLENEKILGSVHQQELARAKQKIFRIEKVIKRDNKKIKALVNKGQDILMNIIHGFLLEILLIYKKY